MMFIRFIVAFFVLAVFCACAESTFQKVALPTPTPVATSTPLPSHLEKVLPFRLKWINADNIPNWVATSKIAAQKWNEALDYEVFTFTPGEGIDVEISLMDIYYLNEEKTKIALGLAYRNPQQPWFVKMWNVMPDAFIESTFLHEFGHILGLSHSEHSDDIMYTGALRERLSENDIKRGKIMVEVLDNAITTTN